jgi:hypothetical protein
MVRSRDAVLTLMWVFSLCSPCGAACCHMASHYTPPGQLQLWSMVRACQAGFVSFRSGYAFRQWQLACQSSCVLGQQARCTPHTPFGVLSRQATGVEEGSSVPVFSVASFMHKRLQERYTGVTTGVLTGGAALNIKGCISASNSPSVGQWMAP